MKFETERLILQPTSVEDADFILELFNTSKWIEMIGDRKVHTTEAAENYIKSRIRPQYDKLGYGNFTIIRKSDQVKIGTCGLYDREGLEDVDLGFAFLPEYWGKGYAFEASTKVITLAKHQFKMKQLSAITLEINKSSQNLLERLNFKFIKFTRIPNDDEELMLYQLKLN